MTNSIENEIIAPEWVSEEEVAKLLELSCKTIRQHCSEKRYNYRVIKKCRKAIYEISFSDLPEYAQKKILGINDDELKYADAPEWAKVQAERYKRLINVLADKKGTILEKAISDWNNINPEYQSSYSSYIRMKRRFKEEGLCGLLSKHGTNTSTVPDEYYKYFKSLYLVQGSPSVRTCWDQTRGYVERELRADVSQFPSFAAFYRRLKHEVPKGAIYLARAGESEWNKKYGKYIERNYADIQAGKVWISDHAQIDVACIGEDGKSVVFPWVTAWRDFKSGKWLAWILQTGNPNSDFIFQSFYYSAEKYGLPDDVIIDNGKDYRCRDFAGGRKKVKVPTNEFKATAMLNELNVGVHFALPYNAQTKPIERDFLKIKELLSKHCLGYRGGNVVERPEQLAENIKKGKITDFNSFKTLFDNFIINVFNKRPSDGKNLNGMSPDELFNQEYKEKTAPTHEALKLFCMRTSKTYTIGRNGIKDRKLGITYWEDWMVSQMGCKVYLRRDIQNYKEAWVFNADNNAFLGKAIASESIAALYADKVSKEEFENAMAEKKRCLKITKSYLQNLREIPIEEQYENYKTAYASVERKCNPKVTIIANTKMDKAIQKAKEMDEIKKFSMSAFMPKDEPKKEETLYLFETDKIIAEQELKGVVNGH